MSKSGRYSADRKKVEALTASKTLGVAACGTIFTAVGDAAITVTLPSIAQAGAGWWCKVFKTGAASGEDVTIAAHDDDGDNAIIGAEMGATAAVMNGDDIVLAAAGNKGTQVELICDGEQWLATGFAVLAAAVTIS